MKYFSYKEFTNSETANRLGINNKPSQEIKDHIKEFVEDVLDNFREVWRSPINVSSGYRCPKLNSKVGGVETSGHLGGWCADLVPKNGRVETLFENLKEWLQNEKIDFDELILEKSGNSRWVHFAYKSKDGLQRKKIKKITK